MFLRTIRYILTRLTGSTGTLRAHATTAIESCIFALSFHAGITPHESFTPTTEEATTTVGPLTLHHSSCTVLDSETAGIYLSAAGHTVGLHIVSGSEPTGTTGLVHSPFSIS